MHNSSIMVQEVPGLTRFNNGAIIHYLFMVGATLLVLSSFCVATAFPRSTVPLVPDGLARSRKGSFVDSIREEWRSREHRSSTGVDLDTSGPFGRQIRGEDQAEGVYEAKQEQKEEQQLMRVHVVHDHTDVLRSTRLETGEERRWLKSVEECNNLIKGRHCQTFPGTRPAAATGGAALRALREARSLAAAQSVNSSEAQVLLTWSSSLRDGPKPALATWNVTSQPNFCRWKGVSCQKISHVNHVVSINLKGNKISGSISSGLTGLPYLTTLLLSDNHISGPIPQDLANILSLQTLDLSFNALTGSIPRFCGNISSNLQALYLYKNKLSEGIPPTLGQCKQLTTIVLGRNKLEGAIPSQLGTLPKLQELVLSQNGLGGALPPSLGNLSVLTNLALDSNEFNGSIPDEYKNLTALQGLYLNNNDLSGTLADWLADLNVSDLHLYQNQFEGQIPILLGSSKNLRSLLLANNSLSGPIPQALAESQGLLEIDLSGNNLNGSIPEEFGFLNQLLLLQLQQNGLSGTIPINITNCVNLTEIDLSDNQLSGIIPSLDTFRGLQTLSLNDNQLNGSIPSVTNCVNLTVLDLSNNGLSGSIPTDIGQLTNLTTVALSGNSLDGFLPSLGNLIHLTTLNLDGNQFNDSFPVDVVQLKALTSLGLSDNYLEGPLPDDLGNLVSLQFLTLEKNAFSGVIPTSLGNLTQLQVLSLGNNGFEGGIPSELSQCINLRNLTFDNIGLNGTIPPSLGQLPSLQVLHLQGNKLSGQIPDSFGKFTTVQDLDISDNELSGELSGALLHNLSRNLQVTFSLANNRMSGPLPGELGLLTEVKSINLSWNSFSDGIPDEIGNCAALVSLDFAENNLTGVIPTTIGNLSSLQLLNVSHNDLNGSIPATAVRKLVLLEELDLTANKLSGEIPSSLSDLVNLSFLNVSDNDLQGPVPQNGPFVNFTASSFLGNLGLCGPVLQRSCSVPSPAPSPQQSSHKSSLSTAAKVGIAAGVVGFAALVLIAGFIGYRLRRWKRTREKAGSIVARSEQFLPQLVFTVQDLNLATENFSDVNILGTGSLSKVYRGVLPELVLVAVKKLKVPHGTEIPPAFLQELDLLGRLRYRHLVAILGYCFDNEMSALVVQFMSNGSLEEHLHGGPTCDLDWPARVKVAMGVAKALNYLHHDCGSTIVHCDLKPSNVLLDTKDDAHLEDFGLSRLIFSHKLMDMTNSSVGSSMGYFPPEYANSPTVSTKGDVYSYGILLLELITCKKPTLDMFTEEMPLAKWCQAAFPNKISEVLDPNLIGSKETSQKQVILLMKVALMCAKEDPEERPTVQRVLEMLK